MIRLHSDRRRGARVGECTNSKLECFSSPNGLIYSIGPRYMRLPYVSVRSSVGNAADSCSYSCDGISYGDNLRDKMGKGGRLGRS